MKNLFSIYETNMFHTEKKGKIYFSVCLYVPSNYRVFKKDKYSKWCYSVFEKAIRIQSVIQFYIMNCTGVTCI